MHEYSLKGMLTVCVRQAPHQLCSPQRNVDIQGGPQYAWCLLDSSLDQGVFSKHLQWLKCVRGGVLAACAARLSCKNWHNAASLG